MISNENLDLFITGDFCIQDRARAMLAEGKRDQLLDMSAFRDVDYKITNLEGPFIDKGTTTVKTGPSLQNPESTAQDLRYYGFNLLCLANNHIMDYDDAGLDSTLRIANQAGIPVVGAGQNKQEAARPFIIEKNGLRLAIVNMAENEFIGATENTPGFHGYDPVNVFYELSELKKQADKVLVIFHGGHEHYIYPSPDMQKRYRYMIDAGADAVIAHHTHVYSGYERYNNGLIVYSLGNFLFDKPGKRNSGWNQGMGVTVTFSHSGNTEFELHPYIQANDEPGVRFLEDKSGFLEEIERINTVIADPVKLAKEWEHHLQSGTTKKYLTYLEVPNSRYVRGARYYRLIPGWLTRRHRALILNMMRCESHIEIMRAALHRSIRK